ncbi:hypothetical protein V7139_00760 [Neobacillus drentensis]|uniref:hypothetical protein n=1 Tax=Neobacillus drentensis TaxID=220684 RepID=UPI002FFFC73F
MLKKTIKHQVELTYDFEGDLNGYTIIDSSIGPRGEICILAVNKVPEYIDGMFPPVQTADRHEYKAIILNKGHKKEVILKNQKWNYHYIQPMDNDQIVLVCARSHLYENGDFDRNARVFDMSGNQVSAFLLGDGIQNLYVTQGNNIWTSYFDEGIFGNNGWNQPIGSYGLRAWDSDGNEQYKYPNIDPHFISDCYALNVVSDEEVWFYYYTDFELARYYKGNIDYFKPNVEGSDGFIVYEDYVLFRGGYSKHDKYILYKMLHGNRFARKASITLIDEEKKTIQADSISCRGSLLLLMKGKKAYLADLKKVVSEF